MTESLYATHSGSTTCSSPGILSFRFSNTHSRLASKTVREPPPSMLRLPKQTMRVAHRPPKTTNSTPPPPPPHTHPSKVELKWSVIDAKIAASVADADDGPAYAVGTSVEYRDHDSAEWSAATVVKVHEPASAAPFYTIALSGASDEEEDAAAPQPTRERQTIGSRLRPLADPASLESAASDGPSIATKLATGLMFGGVGLRRLLTAAASDDPSSAGEPGSAHYANAQSIWVWRNNTHTVVVPEAGCVVVWEFAVKGHEAGQDVGFSHAFEELSAVDATPESGDAASDAAAAADVAALKDEIASLTAARAEAVAARDVLQCSLDAAITASAEERAAEQLRLSALNATCDALRADVDALEEASLAMTESISVQTLRDLQHQKDITTQEELHVAEVRSLKEAADLEKSAAVARESAARDEHYAAVRSVEALAFAAEARAAAAESSEAQLRRDLEAAREAAEVVAQQATVEAEVIALRIAELAQENATLLLQKSAAAAESKVALEEATVEAAAAAVAIAAKPTLTTRCYTLSAVGDKVLSVHGDGSVACDAAAPQCVITVEELESSPDDDDARRFVALRSHDGRYLSANDREYWSEGGAAALLPGDGFWCRAVAGPCERIELIVLEEDGADGGKWAFKSTHGRFFSAHPDGTFGWGADVVGPAECFVACAEPLAPYANDTGAPWYAATLARFRAKLVDIGDVVYAHMLEPGYAGQPGGMRRTEYVQGWDATYKSMKDGFEAEVGFHGRQCKEQLKAIKGALGIEEGGVAAASASSASASEEHLVGLELSGLEGGVADASPPTPPPSSLSLNATVEWDRESGDTGSVDVPLCVTNGVVCCESLAAASGTDAVASILSCAIAAERNLAGIPPSALILMYHDDEGDLVTVTRSDELMEAVRVALAMGLTTLHLRLAAKDESHGHRITVF